MSSTSGDLSSFGSDPSYTPAAQQKKSSPLSSWFNKTFSKKPSTSNASSSSQSSDPPSPKKSGGGSSSGFSFWKKKDKAAPNADSMGVPSPSSRSSISQSGVLYRPELSADAHPHYDGSIPDPPPNTASGATLAMPTPTRAASGSTPGPNEERDANYRDRSHSTSQTNPSSYYNSTYYSSALNNLTSFQPSSASRENSRRNSLSRNEGTLSPPLDDPMQSPMEQTPPSRPSSAASNQTAASNPSAAFSTPSTTSSKAASMKLSNFRKMLAEDTLDLDALRRSSWNGIPPLARSIVWKILLGYLPTSLSRREITLAKRREEYRGYVEQYYEADSTTSNAWPSSLESHVSGVTTSGSEEATEPSGYSTSRDCVGLNGTRSEAENDILRQIRQDVPRTAPGIPFFKLARTQKSLERLLYIFAVRHTASGYVQGMNDVSTPFYMVFLSEYLYPNAISSESSTSSSQSFELNPNSPFTPASALPYTTSSGSGGSANDCTDVLSDPYSSSIRLTPSQYLDLESDIFWCMSKLLDRIQDNYTFAQPGIQRMVYKLRELIQRIDAPLDTHLEKHHVQYIHFAFRWINCLLMREMPMWCIIRIWDTYLSEDSAATAATGAGGSSGSSINSSQTGNASSMLSPTLTSTLPSSSLQDHYTGFRAFHVYVCAAFLIHFSKELKKMEFQDLVLFLQKLPTEKWGMKEVETLLAQAFIYKSWFHSSPHQLK